MLGIIIILLGAIVYCLIPQCAITDPSLILSFIGILASFIVVGNYAQVCQVKKEYEHFKQEAEKNLEAISRNTQTMFLFFAEGENTKEYAILNTLILLSKQEQPVEHVRGCLCKVADMITSQAVSFSERNTEEMISMLILIKHKYENDADANNEKGIVTLTREIISSLK